LTITWFAISRADCVNESVLYWMRKAGCIQISYGVESGSPRMRAVLGKPLKTDHIKTAFSLTHRFGILARAYFIYGAPGETWETIQETVALLKEIKPLVVISYILEIYPGTQLYADFLARTNQTDDMWLERIEGICHFEVDPALTQDDVLAFGRTIREALYANLSGFTDALALVDDPAFYEMHGDFCSRLAMTFSHGDYANIEQITGRREIAEDLFKRALSYAPMERAFLGLALLKQRDGNVQETVRLLEEGLGHFPESEGLNICLGTHYMNREKFTEALRILHRFEQSRQALDRIALCYQALGDAKQEAVFRDKARSLENRS
jgi:tetratricopeptide (TPR) repeat protein